MKLPEITRLDKEHFTPRIREHFLLAYRTQVHTPSMHFTHHGGASLSGGTQPAVLGHCKITQQVRTDKEKQHLPYTNEARASPEDMLARALVQRISLHIQ